MRKPLKKKKRTSNETRILARLTPDGPLFRIAKVFGYDNGGFALIPSMHVDAPGYVAKSPINYSRLGKNKLYVEEIQRKFNAGMPVKLSYHPSGLAQFSSINGKVVSGVNKSGQIRGVGLFSNPLSTPIRSGPAAGILAWGIEEFNTDPDIEHGVMIFDFSSTECFGCKPDEANALAIKFFTIPRNFLEYATRSNGERIFCDEYTFRGSRRTFDLRVIELPCKRIFLGVLAHRLQALYKSSSGWTISGPGVSKINDGVGFALHAIYPSPLEEGLMSKMLSLDFSPENPIPADTDAPTHALRREL